MSVASRHQHPWSRTGLHPRVQPAGAEHLPAGLLVIVCSVSASASLQRGPCSGDERDLPLLVFGCCPWHVP